MWIARDENGTLHLFSERPVKCLRDWRYWDGCRSGKEYDGSFTHVIYIPEDVYQNSNIKWSDKEPTRIIIYEDRD